MLKNIMNTNVKEPDTPKTNGASKGRASRAERLNRLKESGMIASGKKLLKQQAEQDAAGLMLFPGEEQLAETAAGTCFFREVVFPVTHRHGTVCLNEAKHLTGDRAALLALDDSLQQARLDQALFLDLETTGLTGGAGTLAFLVGLGWMDGSVFRLRQYFLRRPPEERSLLLHFNDLARSFDTVITFNGKSFDLPLLNSRQIMAGTAAGRPGFRYHFDLLHCSRRIWKERLSSCALTSLEENIIGYRRSGDIPGAEIPGIYFDYLRKGEKGQLRQVFAHNVWDILSMAALAGVLVRFLQEADSFISTGTNFTGTNSAGTKTPGYDSTAQLCGFTDIHSSENNGKYMQPRTGSDAVTFTPALHPSDCFSLAKLMLNAGYTEQGIQLMEKILDFVDFEGISGPFGKKILAELGRLYKRRQEWDKSLRCWEKMMDSEKFSIIPFVEAAKIYEHQLKNYPEALTVTEKALEITRRKMLLSAVGSHHRCELDELRHRHKRLRAKYRKEAD